MRWTWLFAVACALLPSAARGEDPQDGEDVVAPLPWHLDAETVFLRRVVDASSGRPVDGATVRLFSEVPHPEPGFGTPVATATSGADGWVRIRRGDMDFRSASPISSPSAHQLRIAASAVDRPADNRVTATDNVRETMASPSTRQ